MVAPENFIEAASRLRRVLDWHGDSMMEAAMADLYRNGTIARQIRRSLELYRARSNHFCDELRKALGDYVTFSDPEGGMAVWAKFNEVDLGVLSEPAGRRGLTVGNGALFNTGRTNYNSTRLGFSSQDIEEEERALGILRYSVIGLRK